MTLPIVNPTDTFTIWKSVSNTVSGSVGDISKLIPYSGVQQPDLVSELNNEIYNNTLALMIALGTQ